MILRFTPTRLLTIGCSWLAMLMVTVPSLAQDQEDLRARFDESVEGLRSAMKEAKEMGARYYHSPAAEADDWHAKWLAACQRGAAASEVMTSTAVEILRTMADPAPEVVHLCDVLFDQRMEEGDYEHAWEIAERLAELEDSDAGELKMIRAAIKTNRFDKAIDSPDMNSEMLSEIPEDEIPLIQQADELKAMFDEELELREAQAKADDLPIVELETTAGKIVLELFEEEAPGTVANFISLVENGHYDGVMFHRVVTGFMAQAGAFKQGGPIGVDYTIYDESDAENARKHFRGSISMATIPGIPNSGSCQFFICFSPQPVLNGRHAVFGRVISDMKVLDQIVITIDVNEKGEETPREDITPTHIIKATVVRKRDHQYTPNRVEAE